MSYQMNLVLPNFEGPLELLLHLLEKNDIDIYDIPIHTVTEQFLAYLEQLEENSLDDISEFVVMAAHLLEVKSKMLLPIHGEDDETAPIGEDDPRYELVQRLIQYKIYKDAATTLQRQHDENAGIQMQRISEIERFKETLEEADDGLQIDISLLVGALNDVINRIPVYDLTRRNFFEKLVRDHYTIEQKLVYLEEMFEQKTKWTFKQLVGTARDKMELIITFLALLEFLRDNSLKIYQLESFSEIIIEKEVL